MFKSPQNIKAAGGLPVSWVHFTKEDPGAKPTVCVSLAVAEDYISNLSVKFYPEALHQCSAKLRYKK